MDFLQRSNKYTPNIKEDRISSKSRVEEKGKTAGKRDEISIFCKSSKVPMQRAPLNKENASSSNQATDLGSRSHAQLDSLYSGQQDENSDSFDIAAKSSLDFARNRHAADLPSAVSEPSPVIKDLENVPNSASRLSRGASTYISWSETQTSPKTTSGDWRKIHRTLASSTPESIRRSLEETGVFRDTGIDLTSRRAGRHSHAPEKLYKHDRTKKTDMSGITEKVCSATQPNSHAVRSPHAGHPPLDEGTSASDAKDGEVGEGAMKRERIVIEHFDAKLGWRERSEPGKHNQVFTSTAQEGDDPEQSRSVAVDRLERARIARVNRPSTTVPVFRPLVSVNGATAQPMTEQETNKQSPRKIAEIASPTRDHGMTLDLGNQAILRMQNKEPDPSTFLPPVHSMVNEQAVLQDVGLRKEAHDAAPVPQVRIAEMDHNGSALLHATTNAFLENSSSYQGLPARGFSAGGGIPETYHHHRNAVRSSLHADSEPYFIHQLPRHLTPYEPSVYRNLLREIGYEEFDMITHTDAIIEPADFQDRDQTEDIFTSADDYIDKASQHANEAYGFHGGDYLESESWNLESGDIDLADENYDMEGPGQEPYDEGQMMVGDEQQHLHTDLFSPAEQGEGYEQYFLAAVDQEQAFWRPYQQY